MIGIVLGELTVKILEKIASALSKFALKGDSAIESSIVMNFHITQLSSSKQNFGNKTIIFLIDKLIHIFFLDLSTIVGHTFNLFQKFSGYLEGLIQDIKAIAILVPGLNLL